ncbi:MAG: hypothetical protein V2I65_17525 [Paracoccaceae bacterium]|jgi:hypothetical protein|nr:hypothetical protein [Paracoccaceae bacterium]
MLAYLSDLTRRIRAFRKETSGAVTVDWVLLSAGTIGLALLVISILGDSFRPGAENIGTTLSNYDVHTMLD